MASTILSDNGVSSGSAGIKSTADSTGALALQTTTAGGAATTALTIDTSQNVGIGTASPSYRVDIQGTTATQRISSTTGTNAAYQLFSNTGQNFYVGLDNSAGNQLLSAAYGATLLGSGAYPMVFGTNNTERMRIDSSGNVRIGTTTLGGKLDVVGATENQIRITDDTAYYYAIGRSSTQGYLTFYGSQSAATGYIFTGAAGERMRIDSSGNLMLNTTSVLSSAKQSLFFNGLVEYGINLKTTYSTTNGSNFFAFFAAGGSQIGGVTQATSTTVAYNTSSDYRLKENVAPLANGLTKVMALKPCNWTWKTYAD